MTRVTVTSAPSAAQSTCCDTPICKSAFAWKTVGSGETLWSIAARPEIYNDPLLWLLLYQANRDQIKDPRQIFRGQTLHIPRNISERERDEAREAARKSTVFPVGTDLSPLR